jgi:hypothetical protein
MQLCFLLRDIGLRSLARQAHRKDAPAKAEASAPLP